MLGVCFWLIGFGGLFCRWRLSGGILLEFSLVDVGPLSTGLRFISDRVRLGFLGVVFVVVGSVLIFSDVYIVGEWYKDRFLRLVVLFVFSMGWLVIRGNLGTLLLGWDGLGVTSFALVVYYPQAKALGAGILTALTNRVGDVFLLAARSIIVIGVGVPELGCLAV